MPADLALRFDADRRVCVPVFRGRDLALDTTPATALLISIGSDRRAAPDDTLPTQPGDRDAPAGLRERGGYPGDAFGPGRIGSRLWLLVRAKDTEQTRARIEQYGREACAWLEARGFAVTATAERLRKGVVKLTVRAGDASISVQRALT